LDVPLPVICFAFADGLSAAFRVGLIDVLPTHAEKLNPPDDAIELTDDTPGNSRIASLDTGICLVDSREIEQP